MFPSSPGRDVPAHDRDIHWRLLPILHIISKSSVLALGSKTLLFFFFLFERYSVFLHGGPLGSDRADAFELGFVDI